ncbi:MAG: hypothetical protein C4289_13340 [Chloroflexota bacterium]
MLSLSSVHSPVTGASVVGCTVFLSVFLILPDDRFFEDTFTDDLAGGEGKVVACMASEPCARHHGTRI